MRTQEHLTQLAEELIKENPEETLVRAHMKAAGLRYTDNAVDRLTLVLQSLDHAKNHGAKKSVSKGSGSRGKDL